MAIGIYFSPPAMSTAQYDECIRLLKKAGAGNPSGRSYHAAFGPPDKLMVFDVWTSQAAFDKFGKTLTPILRAARARCRAAASDADAQGDRAGGEEGVAQKARQGGARAAKEAVENKPSDRDRGGHDLRGPRVAGWPYGASTNVRTTNVLCDGKPRRATLRRHAGAQQLRYRPGK